MNNTKNMTKGNIYKLIILFAIPIFFSNLFQQLYNSIDSLIVGKFIGKEALAAVASSGNLIFLFTSFFIGTSMGAGVIISKYFGEKDYDNLSKAIHTTVAFGIVCSVLLTILGIFLSPIILRWMGTAENVLPNSIIYFRNYFIGASGVIMYNIFNGILQALGNSKRPLIYLIISSCTNVVLDLIFIVVFKWGVGAASAATAISQVFSALLCFKFLLKKGTVYQINIRNIKFHKGMLPQILKYGVPSGVQNSVIALANVVVQSNINSFGDNAMAGCGSYSKIEGFAFIPITCFTMAITTFISQNLGAKEYDRAKKGAKFGIISAMILAEIIGIITYVFAPNLISMFNADSEVVKIGVTQARTMSLFYFLLAYSHSIAAVCRGAGKAIIPMLVMLVVWCGIRVIYISIAMNINHKIDLLFLAYPLTWSISSITYFIYYNCSNWIHGFEKME